MSSANREVVRRHYEDGVNRGDMDVATECFATDYVNHLPGEPEPQRGIEAWKAMFQSFRTGFPDMATRLEDVFSDGDKVAVRHHWTGTHLGEYGGVPATGVRISFTGNDIYRVVGGKIVEEWSEYDELNILRQIGAFKHVGELA